MAPDQGDHPLPQGIVQPQAAQAGVRQLRPGGGVSVKVAHPLPVHGTAPRLPHVVEQGRQPQPRLRRDPLQSPDTVGVDVIAVVGIALVKAHGGSQLGQHLPGEDLRAVQQHPARRRAADQPLQLLRHPLPGDAGQLGGAGSHAGGRPLLQPEVQLGSEPQGTQQTQGVLTEAALRLPHAADDPRRQVGPASEGVSQAGGLPGHSVYGEVPAGQILPQIHRELHPVRAAVVGVPPLPAEGGHLHRQAAGQNGDRPVPHAGLHHPHGGTGLPDLLRPGGGGRVIVVGRPAHQPVPDAASHQDGPVSRNVQPLQHRQRPQVPSLHFHSSSPESPGRSLSYSSRVCPG